MTSKITFAMASLLFLAARLPADTTSPTESKAIAEAHEDPTLPRVLLIGDSISRGYTPLVQRLLAGKAVVYNITNGPGPWDTERGLRSLDGWLSQGRWDVIHFNWGLWDLKLRQGANTIPIGTYERNIATLVERLQRNGAKLIWATTTPVPPVPPDKLSPPRKNSDVIAYNAMAARIMEERHVETDDLYSLMLPLLPKFQNPDDVHYGEAGYEILAGSVAAEISRSLSETHRTPVAK